MSVVSKFVIVAGMPVMNSPICVIERRHHEQRRPTPMTVKVRETITIAQARLTLCRSNHFSTGSRPSAANIASAM